ncbi:MAG: hypothetical protein CVT88_01910 [Candidatus Altiarchaeales archaeon HGW-Altiarchaeales-1]|nr:MAG: hypothetical protein CVT88_01910 [Candidatus Altiarchaeales archaeon HGW-Altiarchaeales-1]
MDGINEEKIRPNSTNIKIIGMTISDILGDPVLGGIEIDKDEKGLIELPEMYRLRHIKQNSFLYLVYPGALHTRFEHSLGVFYIASKIFDRVTEDEHYKGIKNKTEWRKRLRIAALLHDIGHGPLAHLYETMLERNGITVEELFKNILMDKKIKPPKNKKIHEALTYYKILTSKYIREYIADVFDKDQENELNKEVERIAHLSIGDSSYETKDTDFCFAYEIIASEFDADRIEYLVRDSYFTGAKYGTLDYERLVNSGFAIRKVGKDKDSMRKLCIDEEKGLTPAESIVVARAQMYPYVYLHSTARAITAMFVRAFDRIYENYKNEEDKKNFIKKTLEMKDYEFIYEMKDKDETGLIQNIMDRKLHKKIKIEGWKYKYVKWQELHPEVREVIENIANRKDKYNILKKCEYKLEEELKNNIGKDIKNEKYGKYPVIIDIPSFPRLEELKAKVKSNNETRSLEDVSKIAWISKDVMRSNWKMFLFVDPSLKEMIGGNSEDAKKLRNKIEEYVKNFFSFEGYGEAATVMREAIKEAEKKMKN